MILNLNFSALRPNICHQHHTKDQPERSKDYIDWNRVVVEDFMICGIDQWLAEVDQPAEANDGSVHSPECGEAEHLGGVITNAMLATLVGRSRARSLTYDMAE